MEIKKEDLMEILKRDGKQMAEDALEMAAKRLSGMGIEMLEKFVNSTEVQWDDMIFAASEDKLKELAEKIEVKL